MKLIKTTFLMDCKIYFSIFLLKIASILGYNPVVLGPRRSIYLTLLLKFSKGNSKSKEIFTGGPA